MPLSPLSYILIMGFLALHTIGVHYTYAQVPAGVWLNDSLHLGRNHFDRIVPFAFGLLLVYPLKELLIRTARVSDFWSVYLPVSGILAQSGFFEIVEAFVAQIVSPDLSAAYFGTQGANGMHKRIWPRRLRVPRS